MQGENGRNDAPIIEVKGVTRTFRIGTVDVQAVRNVDLSIPRGRFITLVGRSGSGKTTLLNLMAGLDTPTSGTVLFEGQDISKFGERQVNDLRRHRLGIVFQSFALLPLLSAYENVELPLRISGVPGSERIRRAQEVLEMVGLARRADHRPFELSGGEQQRVAIARAMAMRPDVLLADEPTGELDSDNAGAIFGLFRQMVDSESMTIVATTHDRTLLDLADDIYRFHDGQLAITELGLVKRAPEVRASSEHAARASAVNPFAPIARPPAPKPPVPPSDTPPRDEEPEPPEEPEAVPEKEPVAAQEPQVVEAAPHETGPPGENETVELPGEPPKQPVTAEDQATPAATDDPQEVDHSLFRRPKSD